MENLIWIGSAITVAGLFALLWTVVLVTRAKKANLDDEEMRARLAKIIPINMIALFVSVIGLMAVILGISLR
jgi:hypothetical protein